ncbi:MAG: sensor histidine kinase [Sphingorhabdus sp.]|nr:sensor histidine kinase [Sphingorhabdus sp.]
MNLVAHWRRNLPSSIYSVLTLFACAIAIIVAILISDYYAAQRAAVSEHRRLSDVARLAASSYERQVDKFRLVATTLSADPDVADLLDKRNAAAASTLNERLANLSAVLDASVIYLLDAQGTTIAASNWRQPDSFMGENYQFRAYFKQTLSSGEYEQFALGTRSRVPGLFVARRVAPKGNAPGILPGVLVVKIRFDRLEREWKKSAGTVFVTSGQGVILVSSVPKWRFETTRKLNETEQEQLRAQVEFGERPLLQNALFARNAVGGPVLSLGQNVTYVEAQESLPNGWIVHVLSPLGSALDAARNFGRLVILAITGLIAALFAFYILRRRAIIAREQRENAARIADLKDRLVQSNKLSILGQIAAGVGHEINQPMAAIGLRAQNAHKLIAAGRTADAAKAIEDISALTKRVGAITAELRRFARRGERRGGTRIGPVALQSVIDGTLLLLGDRIRSSNIILAVDKTDARVIGEQGRLEQIFVNLFQNALDAIGDPAGGSTGDATGNAAGGGGRIDLTITRSGETISIRIKDSGPGIGPDMLGKLFQPFSSSKDDGMGLGLVICRDIIAEFDGEISAVPAKIGAEFLIKLKAAS